MAAFNTNNIDDVISQLRSYDQLAEDAASRHGVDPNIIKAMISQESAYNPKAVSSKGAQGLMQLMPQTAQELGVQDVTDPAQNIEGGTRYFASLLKKYNGDPNKALAAYNAGPGNVDSGKADKFAETQNYVRRIMANVPQAPQQSKAPQAPVDTQPQDIEAQIAALRSADNSSPTQANPAAPKQANPVAKPPAKPESFLEKVTDYLPAAGGAVGGAFGSVGGAAAGGAAGKGYKDVIDNLTELPRAIKDVVSNLFNPDARNATVQGFKQGALEGTGQALKEGAIQGATEGAGKVIQVAGKGLVKAAFKPTAKMIEANPQIVEDIIAAGVNPTQKGVAKATAATNAARAVADQAVMDASAAGASKVPPQEILSAFVNNPSGAKSLYQKTGELGVNSPAFSRIAEYEKQFLLDNPSDLDLAKTLSLRRAEDNAASKVYEGAIANPSLEQQLHASVASGARKALEDRVPGLADLNGVTQNNVQVLQAVENALQQRGTANTAGTLTKHLALKSALGGLGFAGGGVPGSLAGLALAQAAENPTLQSVAGRALFNVGPLVTNAIRTGQVLNTAAGHAKTKSSVDALYQRYRSQGDQQD